MPQRRSPSLSSILPATDTPGPEGGTTQARPKAADIRHALEQEIATRIREPGERLDETALAERFGVSRTPVREAINQLASVGLIDQIPHRGAFVRSVGIGEIVEMFEVMAELEGMAGRLAARRANARTLERLREAMRACTQAAEDADSDVYYYENERFHEAIYEMCGNGFLASEARRLQQRLRVYRRLQLRVGERVKVSLGEHARIVRAIAKGEAEDAERELRAHIAIQGERFADLMGSSASDEA